jgi:CXXX repeat modification system protein
MVKNMENGKKCVGKVTPVERDEIKLLYERKNGLLELFNILTKENHELYDKIVRDLGECTIKYQEWWDVNSTKYNWEKGANARWQIDFNSCEVFLV